MSVLTVKELERAEALQTLIFPLIVPSEEEALSWKGLDFSKSALNACYSKPERNERGEMVSWFEVEIVVDGQHDLPPKEKWFYIITDDGYGFKARFTGRKVKKLRTFENPEIIGRWVKGRLAEWGCVCNFEYVYQDKRRIGIITKEALESYGGDQLILKKTSKTKKDGRGTERDVWFLSFPYKHNLDY